MNVHSGTWNADDGWSWNKQAGTVENLINESNPDLVMLQFEIFMLW